VAAHDNIAERIEMPVELADEEGKALQVAEAVLGHPNVPSKGGRAEQKGEVVLEDREECVEIDHGRLNGASEIQRIEAADCEGPLFILEQ
jgi:hypothetical protein